MPVQQFRDHRDDLADRLVADQLHQTRPEQISLRLNNSGNVSFALDRLRVRDGFRDDPSVGVERDRWWRALGRQLAQHMRTIRDHAAEVDPGFNCESPDWPALRAAVSRRGVANAEGISALAAAVKVLAEASALSGTPISQAEFTEISGLHKSTVSYHARKPDYPVTREHAEQIAKERRQQEEPKIDRRKANKGSMKTWFCRGCGETICIPSKDRPTCPKCPTSPGFEPA